MPALKCDWLSVYWICRSQFSVDRCIGNRYPSLNTLHHNNLFGLAQLHSSITVENREDLERVQKTVLKIILGLRYKSYQNALDILELETLEKRREKLCLNFARKASKHPKCKNMFPFNEKIHKMKTRRPSKFKVLNANTERMKKSQLIFMQTLLNKNELRNWRKKNM